MQIGELVVLVQDVEGVEAGREGRIMGARDNMVMVGCRSRDRLQVVLARTWEVLPQELFRRLCERERNKPKPLKRNSDLGGKASKRFGK